VNEKNNSTLQNIASFNESILKVAREMSETNKRVVEVLEKNTTAVAAIEKFWGRIVIILVSVLSILAGVKSIGDILGTN
jgi:hypothetical protein